MCFLFTSQFSTNAILTLLVLSVFVLTNTKFLKLFTLKSCHTMEDNNNYKIQFLKSLFILGE